MSLAKVIEQARVTGSPCVCGNLRAATREVTQVYEEALRPFGLRMPQFGILMATLATGPVTLKKLADVTHTDRTTLTRSLRLLEEQRLIRSEPGEDRRARVIRITEKGHATLERAFPIWEKTQTKILDRFGRKRWRSLRDEIRGLVREATA